MIGNPVALARIGVALVVWAEWMGPLRPVHHLHRIDVLLWTLPVWIGTSLMLFGLFSRTAAAMTGVSMIVLCVWGHLIDLQGGGVALGTLEAWVLGWTALGLAFTPCGATLSVDALRGTSPGPDRGGGVLLKVLFSVTFLGLALSHTSVPFLSGLRFEQVVVARYGTAPLHPWLFSALAVLWWALELGLAFAPWLRRRRGPAFAVGLLGFGLAYSLLFLGSFPAVMAMVALGSLGVRESETV